LEIDTGGTCGESGVAGGRAAEPLGQGEKNRGIGDPGSEKGDGEICPPRRIFNLGRQTVGDIFLRPLFARSDREVFRRVSLIVTVNYLFKFKPVKVISECSA
jgi:hypothetical protein